MTKTNFEPYQRGKIFIDLATILVQEIDMQMLKLLLKFLKFETCEMEIFLPIFSASSEKAIRGKT